jgi:hypothetical protein
MKAFFLFFLLIGIGLSSCKKMGCTDVNSMNFEKEAQKNDGSCTYEGSVGIWFDSIKAVEYFNAGVQSLTYMINGEEVGTVSSVAYGNTQSISCASPEVFLVDFSMGKAETQSFNLYVKRETGAVIDNYPLTVNGGKCTLFLMK